VTLAAPTGGAPARVPYVANCEIRTAGRTISGLIYDLSPFGCFVHVQAILEGEFVLRFLMPDGGPPAEATVSVLWCRTDPPADAVSPPVGCGVRFVVMSPEDRRRVETLVETFRMSRANLLGAEQATSQAVRVPIIAPCRLSGDFGVAGGRTCNLSIFGVYAAVAPIPPDGATGQIEIWLPRRPQPLSRRATVTWTNPHPPSWERPLPPGCGVRFENLSLREVRFLSGLIDEALGKPPEPDS